jgi:hypothetical protein
VVGVDVSRIWEEILPLHQASSLSTLNRKFSIFYDIVMTINLKKESRESAVPARVEIFINTLARLREERQERRLLGKSFYTE